MILSRKAILKEFQAILGLEEEAAKTYHQLAEDCDDAEIKMILEQISQDEWTHVKIAQKLVEIAKGTLNTGTRKQK